MYHLCIHHLVLFGILPFSVLIFKKKRSADTIKIHSLSVVSPISPLFSSLTSPGSHYSEFGVYHSLDYCMSLPYQLIALNNILYSIL